MKTSCRHWKALRIRMSEWPALMEPSMVSMSGQPWFKDSPELPKSAIQGFNLSSISRNMHAYLPVQDVQHSVELLLPYVGIWNST